MHRTYRALAGVAHRVPLRGRPAESVRGRRAAGERWIRWAAESPGEGAPTVWFHAASVGEAAAAAPVARSLRQARPDLKLLLTYSSPSMVAWPGGWPVDRADYVPLDAPGPLHAVFDALRPSLLCFSRGDLWPELVATARARRVPVAVSGGTLAPSSARARWPGRVVLRTTHRTPAWIGACTAVDAEGWRRAGARPETVEVTGDPRHDALLGRRPDPAVRQAVGAWAGDRPVLVAGSLEPGDVAPVVDAVGVLVTAYGLRALLVPHEPDGPVHTALVSHLAAAGVEHAVWPEPTCPLPEAAVVIVRSLGLLADLWGAARVAWVGGGFDRGRLHAAAEPAAAGVPMVVGPRAAGQRDISRLEAVGAARLVNGKGSASPGKTLDAWLRSARAAREAGAAGRATLDAGAAGRTAERLLQMIR